MSTTSVNPLVVRFGAFGDMVLLIPALKFLERRYGAPCDVVSSGGWTPPLLDRVPAAARCFMLTSRRAPYWFNRSQHQLVAALRCRPAGPVYVFEPDEKPLSLLRRAKIKPTWICTLRDLPRLTGEHILAHTLRLAHETPLALRGSAFATFDSTFIPDTRPTLTDEDRRDCAAWLAQLGLAHRPLVLLQPGNKKTMKRGNPRRASNVDYWPEANWAHVIDGIRAALPDSRAIVCGTPAERPIAEEIVAHLADRRDEVIIAADALPIPRLLALQACAHSMISVNTGPAHSAAAMGCPLVAMFTRHAHRAADLYAPVRTTAPVVVLQSDAASTDITLHAISPETVVAAWRNLAGV